MASPSCDDTKARIYKQRRAEIQDCKEGLASNPIATALFLEQLINSVRMRRLTDEVGQDVEQMISHNNSTMAEEAEEERTPTQNLITALTYYVPVWMVGFALYCYVRRKLRRTYAVRQWVPHIHTTLADDPYGYVSWIWKVYGHDDDTLLQEIGLDALCFLRLIHMGLKLSLVGIFNSLWLIPIYCFCTIKYNTKITKASDFSINAFDWQEKKIYYICTVLASYVFFLFAYWTILREFRWFVTMRHKWLSQLKPQNYTILVRNIPKHLRSDITLKEHFSRLYGADRVLEASCCLFLNDLEAKVQQRKICLNHLENARARALHHGKRPQHTISPRPSSYKNMDQNDKQVDSIDAYTKELNELNTAIAKKIELLNRRSRPGMMVKGSAFRSFEHGNSGLSKSHLSRHTTESTDSNPNHDPTDRSKDTTEESSFEDQTRTARANALWAANRARRRDRRHRVANKMKAVVRLASTTITGEKDGTPDDAGFVTFTSLVAMHGALQMKQHPDLFAMETETAPEPCEIFWNYVGKDRGVLQTGRLISLAMTLTLCLFWTFIVSFIVGLTDADHLATVVPLLAPFLDKHLWIGEYLRFLSPILLLIFNSGLLPIILKAVSRFECPASESILEASAFWKMAAFTVIQTFFVSLISGSVTVQSKIQDIFADPHEFVRLLAKNLPAQDAYFMQLLTVSTCIGTLLELFRIVPLFQCAIRKMMGRNLTEKQRCQAIGPFKPLCVVDKIYFSRIQARFLLYFMVLFVYSTISPLINWFCLIFFMFLGSVYRHQFIYNYPNTPDSGGMMWIMFMAVVLGCIVIAQITLWGFLGLKKAGIAISTMVPLMVITGLFIIYMIQNFFSLGRYLPAHTGLGHDLDNAENGVDFEPFRNLYRNPALLALENDDEAVDNSSTTTPPRPAVWFRREEDES